MCFQKSSAKPVIFFGIPFRNHDHKRYFILSSSITLFAIIVAMVEKLMIVVEMTFGVAILQSIVAAIIVSFRKENETYSKDCIWWNLILATISQLRYYFYSRFS